MNLAVKRNAERFLGYFLFRLARRGRSPEPVTVCDRFAKASRSAAPALLEMLKAIRALTKKRPEPKRRGIGFTADWS